MKRARGHQRSRAAHALLDRLSRRRRAGERLLSLLGALSLHTHPEDRRSCFHGN
jgi:hypothetical protein